MSKRLMIPGPVTLNPAANAALAEPVEAHYGPDWVNIHNETIDLLKRVFQTEAETFALVGSGSAGLDAAIGSALGAGDKAIIGVNGFFGQRLSLIARHYGVEAAAVEAEWGQALDTRALAEALDATPDAKAVIVTQVETSTGVLNPVREIARVARERDVLMVVDAVSALGGTALAMDEWGVDLCVSASQKALGGPAGLAVVAAGPRAWEAIEARSRLGRGWYMNLLVWREAAHSQKDWHPFPVTMPTNVVRGLREGLRELMEEGLEARWARFARLAKRLRMGLADLGYRPLAKEAEAAPVVTAARSLPGVPSGEVVEFLDRAHDIRISGGGFGPLRDTIFRIGHMAPGVSEADIEAVLRGLADFKREAAPAASQAPG